VSRDASTNGHGPDRTDGGGDDPVSALRAGGRETAEELRQAKDRISAAVDERRGGPAEDVDDARAKLDDLRVAIDRDLAALRARVPDTDEAIDRVRTVGIAVGGGLAALLTLRALTRSRKQKARRQEDLREQAIALARELAKLDEVELVLDEEAERGGRGRRIVLLLIAAIGVAATVWTRLQPPPEELDVWGPPT
jgi:hypothetical protein